MKSGSPVELEMEEMGSSHGDESNISQSEDHTVEMVEMVEMSSSSRPLMRIP